jgi:ATPase subunit of ABC transporter with duplicated ATPase domains
MEVEAEQNRLFDKFWKQEEVWIRKGIEARRTRNEGRVRRLEQLRRDRSARRERLGQVGFSLDAGERSGQVGRPLAADLDVMGYPDELTDAIQALDPDHKPSSAPAE